MPESKYRIGVLMHGSVQLLDTCGIDLFFMMTKWYLKACNLPESLVNQGLEDVDIEYIDAGVEGEDGPELQDGERYQTMTANLKIHVTSTIDSPAVAPGSLDVLLIPGPNPSTKYKKEALDFMVAHANSKGTSLLSICTGIFPTASSGVLNGKKGSGPRAVLSMLEKQFPEVKWDDGSRRWVRDGNIWSSGGITNGLDMIAAFIREQLPGPVCEVVLKMADVGDRGETYGESSLSMNVFFVWQILKAAIFGKRK